MNSRAKGKRGELEFCHKLREAGFDARRGRQYAGSPDSPDVVCPDLPWLHWEVKVRERLNIAEAYDQAHRDAGPLTPAVAHRRNHWPWLVTLSLDDFLSLVRESMPPKVPCVRPSNPTA